MQYIRASMIRQHFWLTKLFFWQKYNKIDHVNNCLRFLKEKWITIAAMVQLLSSAGFASSALYIVNNMEKYGSAYVNTKKLMYIMYLVLTLCTYSFRVLMKRPLSTIIFSLSFPFSYLSFTAELTINCIIVYCRPVVVTHTFWLLKTSEGTLHFVMNTMVGYNIFWRQWDACF